MLTLALPPPPPDGIKNIYIKRIHYLEYALIKYINYHYNFIFICLTLSVTVTRHLIHISNQQTKTQSYCCSTSSKISWYQQSEFICSNTEKNTAYFVVSWAQAFNWKTTTAFINYINDFMNYNLYSPKFYSAILTPADQSKPLCWQLSNMYSLYCIWCTKPRPDKKKWHIKSNPSAGVTLYRQY